MTVFFFFLELLGVAEDGGGVAEDDGSGGKTNHFAFGDSGASESSLSSGSLTIYTQVGYQQGP